MYCQHCGNPLPEQEAVTEIEAEAAVDATADVTSAEVEIARIHADRDIKIARIGAGVIDAERDADLAHAEGKAEALEAVIEPPAAEGEPAVVVVDADADDGQADEPDDGNPPPIADEPSDIPPPAKSAGMSWY